MNGYGPTIWISVVVTAVMLLGSSAHAQGPESIAPALDRLMTDLHERGYFNGAIVVGSDEIVYEKGFGYANVAEAIPFTTKTPADVASIAKTFTAAAVLMLEAEGRIDLDEPVSKYLPEFPYLRVRVRHLLAHTSGLLPTTVYFARGDIGDETRTNQKLLDIIAEQKPPLSFVPGTAFQYSNAAFDLAALLIERVTGVSYASFLEERIFTPLKMDSAFVRPACIRDWKGTPTLGYRVVESQLIPYDPPDNEANYGSQLVYASARDIFAWTRSFYTKPVLSASALQQGLEPPSVGNQHRSAIDLLSWYYSDDGKRFYFNGFGQGFRSLAYWDAENRYSIVWVNNKSVPLPDPLLTSALVDIMEGRSPAAVVVPDYAELGSPPAAAMPSMEDLASLSGRWRFGARELTIGMREEIYDLLTGWPLFARVDDGPVFHIFPGENELYIPALDAYIWFTQDDHGRHLHWNRVFEPPSTWTRVAD